MKATKLNLLVLLLVSKTIPLTTSIYLNNVLISHDLLHGRRHNSFNYNYKDWETNGTTDIFDYNLALDDGPSKVLDYDVSPWWTAPQSQTETYDELTTSTDELTTPTPTTPVIYVTIPTDNTLTQPTVLETSSSNLEIPMNVTETQTSPETISQSIADTESPVANDLSTVALNETTELIMTFPVTTTVFEWTTLPSTVPDFVGVHYPPNMTFPSIGPTFSSLETLPPELTMEETMITVPPKSEIRLEFEHDMEELGAGAFTTFLHHAFKVVATKEPQRASELLLSMETELVDLQRRQKLSGFSKSTQTALMYGIQMLSNAPIDVIQAEAAMGDYLIKNRGTVLDAEILELLTEADSIYIEGEEERIEALVEDLHNYPNTSKSAQDIAREVFDAVLLAPMKRVYGTAKEKLMVQQLDALVVKMLFSGYSIQRRQGERKTTKRRYIHHIPRTTTKRTTPTTTISTRWTLRSRRPRTSPMPLTPKMKKTEATTIPNIYHIYAKNETIKKSFQQRMKRYKAKRDPNAWKKWRSKFTTTTTTTQTTTKPKRTRKSIYVVKKYVKKTLKKRKIKIVKNDTDYKLISREVDLNDKTEIPTLRTISELERKVSKVKLTRLGKKRYSSNVKIEVGNRFRSSRVVGKLKNDKFKSNRSRARIKDKRLDSSTKIKVSKGLKASRKIVNIRTLNRNKFKKVKRHRTSSTEDEALDSSSPKVSNRLKTSAKIVNVKTLKSNIIKKEKRRRTPSVESKRLLTDESDRVKRFKILNRAKLEAEQSRKRKFEPKINGESITDEESKLRANLDDAFFHTEVVPVFRRAGVPWDTKKKMAQDSSYTDEEAVLKSKLYKAFGYRNGVGRALRRREFINK